MEARFLRVVLGAAMLAVLTGASYRTPNFVVKTTDPQFAREVGRAAEQYRRELAISWLGQPMPNWSAPCMVTVFVGPTLADCAKTKFSIGGGEVFNWRMTLQGSRNGLLDSVLPHEITHTIFASHFRQPLPRWADEGGACSVEHPEEQAKHRQHLIRCLRTRRGIPFNRMFAMIEYPQDITSLYAQAHSLVQLLIKTRGRQEYIAFIEEGLDTGNWPQALANHYHIASLGQLQATWLSWVRRGFPAITSDALPTSPPARGPLLAVDTSGDSPSTAPSVYERTRPKPTSVARVSSELVPLRTAPPNALTATNATSTSPMPRTTALPDSTWHAAGSLRQTTASIEPSSHADASGSFDIQLASPQTPVSSRTTVIRRY